MVVKRRVSERFKAQEPAKKKAQQTTRDETEEKQSEPPPPTGPPPPTKLVEAEPLPTWKPWYPENLGSLQSIAESGVLASSLQRSRNTWLNGGVLERYWIKPSKKKGWIEPPTNPSRDSMLKIGTCRIDAEPHIFDATLFSIRDTTITSQTQASRVATPPVPAHNTFNTPSAVAGRSENDPTTLPPALSSFHSQFTSHGPNPQSVIANNSHTNPSTPRAASPNSAHSGSQQILSAAPAASSPLPTPGIETAFPPPQLSQSHNSQGKPSQDPVIQMLAQRASANADLKVLMKVVASGAATQDQLKIFQSHIDDLNSILSKQRESQATSGQPTHLSNPHTSSTPTQQTAGMPTPYSHANASWRASQPLYPSPLSHQTPTGSPFSGLYPTHANYSHHIQHPYSQPPSTYQPPPKPQPHVNSAPKHEITGACIEFNSPGCNHDRYLIPRNSILEFVPDERKVIATFLVVRKDDSVDATQDQTPAKKDKPATPVKIKKKPGPKPKGRPRKYPEPPPSEPEPAPSPSPAQESKPASAYTPVTIRITTDNPRVMEALSRGIAPYADAYKYMENIISTCKRAENPPLLLQLPVRSKLGDDDTTSRDADAMTSNVGVGRGRGRPSLTGATATGGPGKRAKNKDDYYDTRCCQFCFTPVSEDDARGVSGGDRSGLTCAECARLRSVAAAQPKSLETIEREAVKKASAAGAARSGLPPSHRSGQMALMLDRYALEGTSTSVK